MLVPWTFRNSSQIKAAADGVLDGRTLHLAYDFDGAAWDMWEQARELLIQLEQDHNLLPLPAGVLRTMQIIFDGHGWSSRTGAVRFVLRCTQTEHDHNATRNARNPIFALGTDKHEWLEKCMRIGEKQGPLATVSMHQRLYDGLVVTERRPADMPAHVRADKDFLPLACIQCVVRFLVVVDIIDVLYHPTNNTFSLHLFSSFFQVRHRNRGSRRASECTPSLRLSADSC